MVDIWKFGEIRNIAAGLQELNYPESLALTYLSNLYSRINCDSKTRKILEQYDKLVANGLDEKETFIEMSKLFENDPKSAGLIIKYIKNDRSMVLFGLANRFAGVRTYDVLPMICGNVIDDFITNDYVAEGMTPDIAEISYLVKAADPNSEDKFVKNCGDAYYLGKVRDEVDEIIKQCNCASDLDGIRSRIKNAVRLFAKSGA